MKFKFNSMVFLALFVVSSCTANNASTSQGEPVEMEYAENLKITDFDGYSEIVIRNPWDTTATLARYALVEKGHEPPQGFTQQQIIRIPLENSVVYSSIHNGLIKEFGAIDAVKGTCDTDYIFDEEIKQRIKDGRIADCGSSMSPNMEQIIRLSPGAVLLSPFENNTGHGKLDQAGIPIVECADYMETSPLARAEWMKFYGRLYGAGEKADSMFAETKRSFLDLKQKVADIPDRPRILMDKIYGQSWSLPAGNSTMGKMIEAAGGENPFGKVKISGSLQLSPEKVLYDAGDADIWLIRFTYKPLTMQSLAKEKPMYSRIKAFSEGKVYGSDSSQTHIFEDMAFHPHWILRDLIGIFHPEVELPGTPRGYFYKLPEK